MFYIINNDKLEVETKHEDGELLASYVLDNNLSLAVTLINGADDLVLNFTLVEMKTIHGNLAGNPPKWEDDTEASEACFETIEWNEDEFPFYSKALGKKLIKQGEKELIDSEPRGEPTEPRVSKPRVSKPKDRSVKVHSIETKRFVLGIKSPRVGSIHSILTDFISSEIGDSMYDDIIVDFVDKYRDKNGESKSDNFAKGYLMGAIKKQFVLEVVL